MPALGRITEAFNARENHNLGAVRSLNGYRFGFGNYSRWTLIELSGGNLSRTKKSNNPAQLKEQAEVRANFASIQLNFGFRPFAKQYFVAGLGLNLAMQRVRYSFGGDYTTPVLTYTIAPEFFVDYGIKIRFLAKREQRDKIFYLLRLRPSYCLHLFPTDLKKMQQQFNDDPTASGSQWRDNWSGFGFQAGICVPFGPDVEALAARNKTGTSNKKTPKAPKESRGGRD